MTQGEGIAMHQGSGKASRRTSFRQPAAIAGLLAGSLLLAACAPGATPAAQPTGAAPTGAPAAASSSGGGDLTVCIWGTLTGPDSDVNGMSYGTRDFFTQLNGQGGVAGKQVNALLLDGKYQLPEELKIYRRCVDEEQAVVVNGWSTGATTSLRDQTNQDKVPFVTESFSSAVLDPKSYPYIFMLGPTYEDQMQIALQWLASKGGKRVAFMYGNNDYGRAPTTAVLQAGLPQKLGLEVVAQVEFPYDATDVTSHLVRVKGANPDLVYIQASANQAVTILRDAAKVGIPADKFMGNFYDISPVIPGSVGASANGFQAVQVFANWGDEMPLMKTLADFANSHQVEKQDVYYIKGWLKGKAIAAGLESALKTTNGTIPPIAEFRQRVRDAMEGVANLDAGGASEPINWSDHQGVRAARVAQIKDGTYGAVSDFVTVQK